LLDAAPALRLITPKRHRSRVRQPWAATSCPQCVACTAWLGAAVRAAGVSGPQLCLRLPGEGDAQAFLDTTCGPFTAAPPPRPTATARWRKTRTRMRSRPPRPRPASVPPAHTRRG